MQQSGPDFINIHLWQIKNMTQAKNIFSKTFGKSKILLAAFCVFSISVGTVMAASNGCDEEKNDFINQRLALCSTHAYNIGMTQNPEGPGEREIMNEVVALKTTIMTQQMKKQYDYLETTIKRFKTQLEKAILVAKVEAAGASSESGGASGSRNTKTSMGDDCTGKNRTDTVYCLRQNYAKLRTAVDTKNFGNDLKEQIVKDAYAISYLEPSLMEAKNTGDIDCKTKSSLNTTNIPKCLGYISGATLKLEEGGKTQTKTNRPYDE